MKKFALLFLMCLSTTAAAQSSTQVLVGGVNTWPPKGPRCEKFVACCEKSKLKGYDTELFCKMRAAHSNLDCTQAISDLADYIREKGKEPPPECIQARIQQ